MIYLTWMYYKYVFKISQEEKNELKRQKQFYNRIKTH